MQDSAEQLRNELGPCVKITDMVMGIDTIDVGQTRNSSFDERCKRNIIRNVYIWRALHDRMDTIFLV